MVLFVQKWLYSGKVVLFGQKKVVFRQNGCIEYKSSCILAKWLYSGKVVEFGEKLLYLGKLIVFG